MNTYEVRYGTLVQVDDPPKVADMVAVVRCKDCKRTEGKADRNGHFWCWYHELRVEPDGFCAWGRRADA